MINNSYSFNEGGWGEEDICDTFNNKVEKKEQILDVCVLLSALQMGAFSVLRKAAKIILVQFQVHFSKRHGFS